MRVRVVAPPAPEVRAASDQLQLEPEPDELARIRSSSAFRKAVEEKEEAAELLSAPRLFGICPSLGKVRAACRTQLYHAQRKAERAAGQTRCSHADVAHAVLLELEHLQANRADVGSFAPPWPHPAAASEQEWEDAFVAWCAALACLALASRPCARGMV